VASSETNEAKRELMSRVVDAQLRGNGWKPDQLAAQLRQEAEISDRRNAEAWQACAFGVQKMHAAQAARLRERADFLETIGV
jgi:hypothetical protein